MAKIIKPLQNSNSAIALIINLWLKSNSAIAKINRPWLNSYSVVAKGIFKKSMAKINNIDTDTPSYAATTHCLCMCMNMTILP